MLQLIETSRDYHKEDLNEYGWWMNWHVNLSLWSPGDRESSTKLR